MKRRGGVELIGVAMRSHHPDEVSISTFPVRRWDETRTDRGERRGTMKYMLLIYGDEQAMAHATPEQNQAVADEYEVFTKSIVESGNFLDGDPFLPTSTASTVTVREDRTERAAGPAVATDPQLMAYYKVEADSPEHAAELAARIPGARYGAVEVRQVVVFD
jgi:hypothetical protein